MEREFSAGGVVVRNRAGIWWMAAIELPMQEPPKPAEAGKGKVKRSGPRLAIPKGTIDAGERPLETAIREIREETGLVAVPVTKLFDSKYFYVRSWGDGKRVFKVVSFYLLRYRSGRIDDLHPDMRVEVQRARWIRLADAPALLTYK